MRWNPHGGDVYSCHYDYDFSVNVNPLGPPDSVKEAVRNSVFYLDHYPDVQCRELRTAVAEKENVKENQLIFGNGAAELIYALVQAVRPQAALLTAPTFAEYEAALSGEGCEIRRYALLPENGFRIGEDYLSCLTEEIGLVFLCNPNNPTGAVTDRELLLRIAARCREREIVLVLDECFLEFLPSPETVTLKDFCEQYENLFVLRAFTKTYAMPALRLGYGICGNEGLLRLMTTHMQAWNISIPAQKAGVAAVSEKLYVEEARKLICEERTYLEHALISLGYTVWRSAANYILFRGAEGIAEKLKERKILIRDCQNYCGLSEGYYRIAVRTHSENQILIETLKQIAEDQL